MASKIWSEVFAAQQSQVPHKRYGILFTPRSGSTWLCEQIAATGRLGLPLEYFNLDAARFFLESSNCSDVYEYYRHLQRVRQCGGVFGFEIAYPHLHQLLKEGYADLFDDVDEWFVLRRKDYIAQAVSFCRAEHTGVYHSFQSDEPIPDAPYTPNDIGRVALSILGAEYRIQNYLTTRGIAPKSIWYEEVAQWSEDEISDFFCSVLNLSSSFDGGRRESVGFTERRTPLHVEKISVEASQVAARRFREENPEFIHYWDEQRGAKTAYQFLCKYPRFAPMAGEALRKKIREIGKRLSPTRKPRELGK